ncbi:hypothetical protein Gotur_008152 [Gossypium turneri]
MPDMSRSRVHLRWLLKLVDFRGAGEFSWGLPYWQHYIRRCAGRRDRGEQTSEVACHYCNHGHGFAFHFYVLE